MDKIIKKIIKEIAEEEDLPIAKVEASIRNLTDWTREAFIKMEATAILWPWFATFKVIKSRVEGEDKEKVEEYINKRKTNKNGTTKENNQDKD